MAKWVSPEEKRRREVAAVVARLMPEARKAADEMAASWSQEMPRDWSNQLLRAMRSLVLADGVAPELSFALAAELNNALQTPFAQRAARERRAAEKAAEAQVDTNRPVVATCDGAGRIGEMVLLRDGPEEHRVLVRIDVARGWDDELGDTEWYSKLAEPNEAEKTTAEYQQMAAKAEQENAYEARQRAIIEARRERELADMRARGEEPSWLDELFAGTNDN